MFLTLFGIYKSQLDGVHVYGYTPTTKSNTWYFFFIKHQFQVNSRVFNHFWVIQIVSSLQIKKIHPSKKWIHSSKKINFSKSNGRALGLLENSINNVFDQRIMKKTSADGEIHSSKTESIQAKLEIHSSKIFQGIGFKWCLGWYWGLGLGLGMQLVSVGMIWQKSIQAKIESIQAKKTTLKEFMWQDMIKKPTLG